jgi:GTP cyclohydrolase IA
MGTSAESRRLTWGEVRGLVADRIPKDCQCYGVPRGGCLVAAMTGQAVDRPEDAAIIVDDLVDSGATRQKWRRMFPHKPFYALIEKTDSDGWIHFPWDTTETSDVEDHVTRILQYIGDDPKRDGLIETPGRVVRSWGELFGGYKLNAADVLCKEFDVDGYDEMIICRNIDFYSTCEHHMQPFYGRAHVGYIPSKKVVGLSKLARLVDVFARRLQIQERLTSQIADAMEKHLSPLGVAVLIEATHFCMVCRGVRKQNSAMTTSSLKGRLTEAAPRAEFLSLVLRQ